MSSPAEKVCLICEGTVFKSILRENGYTGLRCASCGVLMCHPLPDSNVDCELEKHEDEFYSLYAPYKAKWVSQRLPVGELYEIGCGKGFQLKELEKYGYKVRGIEANKERQEYAAKNLGLSVKHGIYGYNVLPENLYDVVFHIDLLAHFGAPYQELEGMKRLLKPGGHLAFEVGVLSGFNPAWYRLVFGVGFPYHRQLFSVKSLRVLFAKAGLEIVESRMHALFPSMFVSLFVEIITRKIPSLFKPIQPKTRKKPAMWVLKLRGFLRYRIGMLFPAFGPLTLLIIAKPKEVQV
jgi:SAM-dependent methyltransferase